MALSLENLARNASMLDGMTHLHPSNGAEYDEGLQKQLLAEATIDYAGKYGGLASNVYIADIQGTDIDDFEKYRKVKIRSSQASTAITGELMPDDWQKIYIIDPAWISYIPQGAYLKYAKNTWIVYKGENMESVLGSAIIRRCNSVINVLDWYGNIVSVPMSYARMATQGNSPHASENSIMAKNYISCVCQYNSLTQDFHENTRMILGKAAYQMRGLNDFTREFTDEQDSVHVMTFTIERTTPLEQDSIELQCADYYSFTWELNVGLEKSMNVGATQQISVRSVRNGNAVSPSEEHPLTYSYQSSDESVLTVSEDGTVTAVGEGDADIVVTLNENPRFSETVSVSVQDAGETFVAFTNTAIDVLRAGETVTISASEFVNGMPTENTVKFTAFGATRETWSAVEGNNTVTIKCYRAATKPLTVRAECNGNSAEIKIYLK